MPVTLPSRILAVDQSYTRCGFAVTEGKQILDCHSLSFTSKQKKWERRQLIKHHVADMLYQYDVTCVIVERVRTFSKGFVSTASIIALGSLVSTIVDACEGNVPVFSVDTRAWKANVLGSDRATKEDAVTFAEKAGHCVDHDAADALCMALYAGNPSSRLKCEQ